MTGPGPAVADSVALARTLGVCSGDTLRHALSQLGPERLALVKAIVLVAESAAVSECRHCRNRIIGCSSSPTRWVHKAAEPGPDAWEGLCCPGRPTRGAEPDVIRDWERDLEDVLGGGAACKDSVLVTCA